MSDLTWGTTVRVKPNAPTQVRPGAVAEIVGIRDIETEQQTRQFGGPVGTKVYLIEFADGDAIEVSAKWVDALCRE